MAISKRLLVAVSLAALAGCKPTAQQQDDGKAGSDTAGAASAAKITLEEPFSKNWMADYVQLRVYGANAAAGNAPDDTASTRIVGGVPAGPSDNPFQISLLNKSVANNKDAHFCGGTLINPNTVVTAAHCSDFITASQVQVLTGARALDGSGTRRNVTRVNWHPRWRSDTNDYDVAVWRLETPAAGPFATLASSDTAAGTTTLATGWGALSEGGAGPINLYKVELPIVDGAICNAPNSYNGKITAQMVCAGRPGGGRDTCQGDSGGPLTLGSVLVGITSWGRGCARPNYYGVYARVANPEIRSFINSNS